MSKKKNQQLSMKKWAGIIPVLILFFPLGVIYLISELNKDKEHMRRNGLIPCLIGFLVLLFCCLFELQKVIDSTLEGQAALLNAIGLVLTFLMTGLLLILIGLFFVIRGTKDQKLIRLICSDHILGLSDLSVLTAGSLRFLRARIDRLLSEERLPGIEAIRQEEPDSVSENTRSEGSQTDLPQNDTRNTVKKKVLRLINSEGLRNALWITAAFFCFGSCFVLLPIWLILAALAFFLELKNEPRNYRIIFRSAVISAGTAFFVIVTFCFLHYSQASSSNQSFVLFQVLFPGIPAAGLQLMAYNWLASRKSQSIVSLRETGAMPDNR